MYHSFTSQDIISALIMGRGQWVPYHRPKAIVSVEGEMEGLHRWGEKEDGPPAKWKRVKGPTPIDSQ